MHIWVMYAKIVQSSWGPRTRKGPKYWVHIWAWISKSLFFIPGTNYTRRPHKVAPGWLCPRLFRDASKSAVLPKHYLKCGKRFLCLLFKVKTCTKRGLRNLFNFSWFTVAWMTLLLASSNYASSSLHPSSLATDSNSRLSYIVLSNIHLRRI